MLRYPFNLNAPRRHGCAIGLAFSFPGTSPSINGSPMTSEHSAVEIFFLDSRTIEIRFGPKIEC
jgi:hypothetical protein